MHVTSAPPEFIITDENGVVIATSNGAAILPTSGVADGSVLAVQADGSLAFETPVVTESLTDLDEWDGSDLIIPGGLVIRQDGGVAGTDEIQIYHDGTDAHIVPQSGNLDLNGYAVGTHNTDGLAFYRSDGADDFHFASTTSAGSRGFHIQGTGAVTIGNKAGSSWYDFEMKGGGLYLNSNNKYIQVLSGYLAWDTAKTLMISEGDGRNGHSNGQGRIAITTTVDSPSFLAELTMSGYNSMNLSVAVEGTLIARQDGGVAGTDEVQIYHDGSNAYIDSQSGDLIFNNSAAKVNASGEFTNNYGFTENEAFGLGTSGAYRSVAFGYNVTSAQSSVAIGWLAEAEDLSVVIGASAKDYSSTGRNVIIGTGASVSGVNNVIIGSENKGHGGINETKIIGRADLLYGAGSGHFIGGTPYARTTDVYFGRGPQYTAVEDYTIHGTGGYGTDIDGSSIYLAGGKGTGAGDGGSLIFQTAAAGASGSTLNTLTTHVEINSDGLIILPTIPTSDPGVSGALWSDGGTLKVS